MSHSVVKDIPPATDNTLVIVVGQDGSLSVDHETLDSLVSLDSETKVSVVRVNDDDGSTVNMTLDTYQQSDTQSQILGELTVNVDEVQRNYNNFLMDHCYTPLTSPSQKHPVPHDVNNMPPPDIEIDDLAHTLSILDGSEKPLIQTISKPQTKIIAKKDNTKTIIASDIKQTLLNKVNKIGVNKVYKSVKTVLTKAQNNKKIIKNEEPELQPEEETEPFEDAEFELNDSAIRKGNKRTYKRRPKIETGEELIKEKPKPNRKSVKTLLKTPPKPIEKVELEKAPELKIQPAEPVPIEHPKTQSPDHKKVIKKDKKVHPKPPIDDGIALFSTPDIIRRVGKDKQPETLELHKITKPAKIEDRSRSEASRILEKPKTPQRLSLDSKLTEKSIKTIKDRRNSDKKVETISAIETALMMSESMINSTQNPQNLFMNTIEPVVPTVEDLHAIIQPNSQVVQMPNVQGQSVNENPMNIDPTPVLDAIDHAILENINPDDLMSEDILDQVAKLVENPDLQNAIDTTLVEGNLNLDTALTQQISHGTLQEVIQGVPPVMQPALPTHQNVPHHIKHPTELHHHPQPQKQPQQQAQPLQLQRQIVRSDGRVVVLPPIEKPATRSSKRKQEVETPATLHKESNEQIQTTNQSNQHAANSKHTKEKIQEKDTAPIQMDLIHSDAESDSDESWNSEDDPDRLWCICKQPHNNRFMICCDTCEDWFHGKCVNVTKAMGQQMEQQGKEWMCPNCIKKQNEGNIQTRRSSDASVTSTKKAEKVESDRRKSSDAAVPACIVCGAPSRASSVYCSDACILKHAQGVERDNTKQNSKNQAPKITVHERATGKTISGPNAPTAANLKQWLKEHPGYEVVRPENKTMAQSKLQLVKNASGKGVSLAVSKKGVQVGVLPHTPKSGSQIKLIPPTKLTPPTTQKTPSKPSQNQTPSKPKLVQTTLKSPPHSASTPVKNKTPTPKVEKIVTKTPSKKADTPVVDKAKALENIRENVRKTLQEQLTTRLKDVTDIKLSEEEVKKLAHDIEHELYKLFGDAGPKYRTKYRSLIFNIKDVKNQTLWRRICDKSIAPAQLVRLSPDDLASQELARWREQENKHQLDMIKKSELEMLQINRTYVLKTHKGEQVMEDKTNTVNEEDVLPGLTADSTSEEVTLPSEKSESSDHSSERHSKSSNSKHSRRDRDSKSSRDRSRERRKDSHHSRDKKKRSRSRDRDKSKSREHSTHRGDRKRSRSRDKHRSSHKSSRHKRDGKHAIDYLDKKSKEILDSLENKKIVPPEDRLWKHVPQQDISVASDSDSDHEPTSTVTIPTPPRSIEPEETHTHTHNHHHSHHHEKEEKHHNHHHNNKTSEHKTEKQLTPEPEKSLSPPPIPTDELNEPTTPTMDTKITSLSKETILWEGNINMIDVAKFFITMHEVSGDCTNLGTELPTTLEIVGRISPDTVWEYISKMKKSNSKVICVIRLTAANVEEKMPYIALYSYLSSRNRLGVIKTTSNAVKDFYILPLASHAPVPQTLLPLSGPGFEESRPHLLLGIIVRAKRKRLSTSEIISAPVVVKRSRIESPPAVVLPTVPSVPPPRSYTPPPSTTRDPRIKLPTIPPVQIPEPPPVTNDEDEPYSPEDSDPDNSLPVPEMKKPAQPELPQIGSSNSNSGTLNAADISSMLAGTLKANTFLDGSAGALPSFEPFTKQFEGIPGLDVDNGVDSLQRKMEELDKCIEKQKEEIRSISQNIVSSGAAANMATNLSNISLPSNLQQILDSIKNIPEQTSSKTEEYTPVAPGYKTASEELTIPLLLPSRTRSQSSRSEKPSTTIPLNLPVTPRDISENLLPSINIPPPLTSSINSTIPLNLPKTRSKITPGSSPIVVSQTVSENKDNKSVLSSLSEEELIRKANEMLGETEVQDDTPEPDEIEQNSVEYSPKSDFNKSLPVYNPTKRPKLDNLQPPVPGLEDEFH